MTGTGTGTGPAAEENKAPQQVAEVVDGGGEREDRNKWGTHEMGAPSDPTVHPDNQRAALWKADVQQQQQQPYMIYSPMATPPNNNPLEPVIQSFHTWTQRADSIARNIWHHLKTGPSVSEAAWGKINLTAKALTEGGFDALFKQIFQTQPDEQLKKTFACYLSTTTGPVAGTLYLSNVRIGFCSDRPLSFVAPSGQQTWSYYKVMIPLAQASAINPVTMRENPNESYIQITTVDNHEFWFMGFVNFDKAVNHLSETLTAFRAAEHGPYGATSK